MSIFKGPARNIFTHHYMKIPSATDYTISGNDFNLNFPERWYTISNFIPISNTPGANPDCSVQIGTEMRWFNWVSAGSSGIFNINPNGGGIQGTYGRIKFFSYPASPQNWVSVAGDEYNGLIKFYLPKTANYEIDGGFFEYYFKNSAWSNAFIGNTSDIVIVQTGTVYKDSISDSNLVVRWDGVLGNAGGGDLISDRPRFL